MASYLRTRVGVEWRCCRRAFFSSLRALSFFHILPAAPRSSARGRINVVVVCSVPAGGSVACSVSSRAAGRPPPGKPYLSLLLSFSFFFFLCIIIVISFRFPAALLASITGRVVVPRRKALPFLLQRLVLAASRRGVVFVFFFSSRRIREASPWC